MGKTNEKDLEQRMLDNLRKGGKDVKVGANGCTSRVYPSPVLGPNSNIHRSKVDELVRKVDEAINGKKEDKDQDKYEMVNHPQHYNNYDMEVIEMMERIWGTANTAVFCAMNAYKYRMRMGTKPGVDIAQDLDKEQWYLKKAKELKAKLFDKSIDMNQ